MFGLILKFLHQLWLLPLQLREELFSKLEIKQFEESFGLLADLRVCVTQRLVNAFYVLLENETVFGADNFSLLLELDH